MTSFESPTGTIPLVFESGVLNICEDGTIEVHLSHSEDEPHPMMTHPEGEQTNIPKRLSKVELVGDDRETVKIRCGLPETDTLPTGFVFRIKGWRLVQLEMSGDLTIVMAEMEETPDWFQFEKIHRFDGPEGGVSLYTGSQPLVETKNRARPVTPKPQPTTAKPEEKKSETNKSSHNYTQSKPKSGCGLLVTFLIIAGIGLSSMSLLV